MVQINRGINNHINGNSIAARSKEVKAGEGGSDRKFFEDEGGNVVSSDKEDQEEATPSTSSPYLLDIRNEHGPQEKSVFPVQQVLP